MKLYVNNRGELTCEPIQANTTVSDLIKAVDDFCQEHINCTGCRQTCCAGLTVYPDQVFLHHLLQLISPVLAKEDHAALPKRLLMRDPASGNWYLPPAGDGRCRFLSRRNRCTIYPIRPLVCRMHVCGQIEAGFSELKQRIYYAYQQALRLEMYYCLQHVPLAGGDWLYDNPVLASNNYDIPVTAILAWVAEVTKLG